MNLKKNQSIMQNLFQLLLLPTDINTGFNYSFPKANVILSTERKPFYTLYVISFNVRFKPRVKQIKKNNDFLFCVPFSNTSDDDYSIQASMRAIQWDGTKKHRTQGRTYNIQAPFYESPIRNHTLSFTCSKGKML